MEYDVYLYKLPDSPCADIRTRIEARDPIAAAFAVMAQCNIPQAAHVFVYAPGRFSHPIGEFLDIELAQNPSSYLVSYDYKF